MESRRNALKSLVARAFGIGLVCLLCPNGAFGQGAPAPGFRPIDLQHAPASEIAIRVQQVVRETDPTAEVVMDRTGNRIWVRGTEGATQVAMEFAKTLDQPSTPAPAENRPAMSVRGYPIPAERLADLVGQLQRRFGQVPGVRIAGDERTSQLVVVAPLAIQNEIAAGLAGNPPAGDTRAPALASGTRTPPGPSDPMVGGRPQPGAIVLRRISWQDFERYLTESFGEQLKVREERDGQVAVIQIPSTARDPTTLRIDRLANTVFVPGGPAAEGNWRQVIDALDQVRQEAYSTRLVSLRNADPAKIHQAVSVLRAASQPSEGDETSAAVQVTEAVRGSGFLPVATRETPAPAGGQPPSAPGADQPPANPDGTQPAPGAQPGEDDSTALLGDVRIVYVPELGAIVIRGPRRAVERVRRIIAEIEEQAKSVQPEVEIIELAHVNSQALATLIVQLYDQVFAPRQGPLSITSLDKPNALLLIGRSEPIGVVKQLIAKLDQPVPAETQLKAFPLKNISAIDAEQLVRGFFVNQPGGGGAAGAGGAAGGADGDLRPALGTRSRVIADYRSNSLIVQASIRDLDEVALFIESIDKEGPEASHEIRIFRLQNALAADLAPILQAAIAGTSVTTTQGGAGAQAAPGGQQQQAGAGQVTRPSTRLSIVGVDSAENRIIDSGVLTDVTVSADANVNALVVRAPSRSMNLVDELIKQLDLPPNVESQVKVFTIENGDATSLSTMLQILFGLQSTGQQGTSALQPNFGALAGAAPGSESPLIPIRFAVDIRTNSIIATGSAGDLSVVEAIVLRLDESDLNTRKMFVYRLKNAPASDVANSISSFLQSQRQIYQQSLLFQQSVSQIEQLERDIVVVPEPVSNSLIVSVTPRYNEMIVQIIEDLDFRPPMVMVQVMICEVTLSDAFEAGVELGLQDSLLFDRAITGASTVVPSATPSTVTPATRNTLAGQSLSTLGVGRSSATLGYGGLVLAAADDSVNILIRALQDAGRLQVLSRPQIMTLNNQPAFVQVGARVPRVTGSSITTGGIVQNQTQDEDVGLLLRIQPRINQDKLIVMTVDTEKSEVGPLSTGIPVAVNANGTPVISPQILTTTAQTTISAHDHQTVVFAGLITKNREVLSRRVPLLSDIPLLGRLFRYDVETNKRTELLIFMTPHIIQDDQDYDWIKHVETERMSWCLADVVEMHGDAGVSGGHGLWGPAPSPFLYPDLDPTGSESIPVPDPADFGPTDIPQANPGAAPTSEPNGEPASQGGSSRRASPLRDVRAWLGPPPPREPRSAGAAPRAVRYPQPASPRAATSGPQLNMPGTVSGSNAEQAAYRGPSPGPAPAGYVPYVDYGTPTNGGADGTAR